MAAGMALAQTPAQTPQQPPAGHMTQRRGEMMEKRQQWQERMAQELNLTDTQKQEAKAIFAKAREEAKPVRDEMRANREALRAAIKADDTARIRTLSAKQGTLMAKLTEIRSDAHAKFYAKLTPEQRAKEEQLHQQMKQRWEQRRQGTEE